MHLKEVRIKNYRSIAECTIKFHKRFQTLLGINEAGKSNILSALALIDPAKEIEDDDIRETQPNEDPIQEAHVWFVFGVNPSELNKAFLAIRPKILCKAKDPEILIKDGKPLRLSEFVSLRTETLYTVDLVDKERRESYWDISASSYTVARNWKAVIPGKSGEAVPGDPETNITNYVIVNTSDYPNIDPSTLRDLTISKLNGLVANKINEIVQKDIPNCIFWRYNEENLLPGRINTASFKSDPNSCLPLKTMFALAGYSDIPGTIERAESRGNGMRNTLKRVGEKTTEHLRRVWPEWKQLRVEVVQNGDHLEAGIEDKYNFFSLTRRSDGFKRFFTFLLMLSAKNKAAELKNNLILIDEPEIGLHPSGQSYVRNELAKIAENNLVVTSTHSIFMIDREKIDSHVIVEKRNEVTTLTTPEKSEFNDEEVLFQALGFSMFQILKRTNLVFEGWRDKKVFETFIKAKGVLSAGQKATLDACGFLHAAGVRDIPRVANTCENLDRRYLIITDGDAPAKQRQRDFRGEGEWLTYSNVDGQSAITTEDYFTADAFNRALRKTFDFHGLSEIVTVDSETQTDRMQYIDKALRRLGVTDTKGVLNDLKEELVSSMKASDIIDEYKTVANKLIEKLAALQAA